MYIIRSKHNAYVTVEPVLNPEYGEFSVTFAWTDVKTEAVRFTTKWQAFAVAKRVYGCKVIRLVKSGR